MDRVNRGVDRGFFFAFCMNFTKISRFYPFSTCVSNQIAGCVVKGCSEWVVERRCVVKEVW